MTKLKFIDLFAGIGGFRLGMEAFGHECVAFCEIDKFARASYKAIHNTEGETEWHDITTVTNEEFRKFRGQVDVICGGFPCQAFSVAGRRLGFEDTRGTLFFEIARCAKEVQPQLLFLENVRGLLSHNKGGTFRAILSTLDELGYDVEWQVLNSKDLGVAQNRERVFIIGHSRRGRSRRVFPLRGEIKKPNSLRPVVIGSTQSPDSTSLGIRDQVLDSRGIAGSLLATDYKAPKQVAIPVLTPDRTTKRQNGRRLKTDGEPMFTLTSQDRHGVVVSKNKVHRVGILTEPDSSGKVSAQDRVYNVGTVSPCLTQSHPPKFLVKGKDNSKEETPSNEIKRVGVLEPNFNQSGIIYNPEGLAPTLRTMQGGGLEPKINLPSTSDLLVRKLTPRECWRLQGFPDSAFDKAQEVNSKTQLYKQAGNSVTVNVIASIASHFDVVKD